MDGRRAILHFVESPAGVPGGGAETVALQLCQELNRSNTYRPLLVANEGAWVLRQAHCRCFSLAVRQKTLDLRYVRELARLIRQHDVALVHAHMLGALVHGALAAGLARRPIIATVHGRLYDLETLRRRLVHRVIARLSHALVAVSEDLRQELLRGGIPASKVRMIPNGTPCDELGPSEAAAARAELGLSDEQPVMVSLAALRPVKGHHDLLRASARVASALPQACLLIVGDGPLREELENEARQLGIAGQTRFLGFRTDARRLLVAADLLINASFSEGQALSILEAMAVGRPVVATRVGGNPELVTDGESGLLAPPHDPEALAAAALSLLRDPERRAAMGRAARRVAQARFDVHHSAARYEELYNEVLGPPRHAEAAA